MTPQAPFRIVPAVERAARLLEILEETRRPMSISDLARRLDASKGTVRDILETLRSHQLLERDEDVKLYRLGAGVVRLANAARGRLELVPVARPWMRRLADQIGEAVLLVRPDATGLLIEEKVDPERPAAPILISATPGRSMPLLAGACGKVILAQTPQEEHGRLLAATPPEARFLPTDPIALEAILADVRARGYALDDQEYMDGIRGVSAPIFGDDDRLCGLLLVSGLISSLVDARLPIVAAAVAECAIRISTSLGAGERARLHLSATD